MESFLESIYTDRTEREDVNARLVNAGFNTREDLNAFTKIDEIVDMTGMNYLSAAKLYNSIRPPPNKIKLEINPASSQEPQKGKDTRKILFVGATGVGKSMLINSMYNYLHRKEFEHPSRYRLDNAEKKTDDIYCYYLQDLRVGYSVKFIDTPGLTSNVTQDNALIEKIKNHIKCNDPDLHAICIVIKATESRLTQGLEYSIRTIYKEFGEAARGNIFTFYTFSDGGEPLISSAVRSLGLDEASPYLVNNSGLYEYSNQQMAKVSWELSMQSFEKFFRVLSRMRPSKPEFVQATSRCSICNIIGLAILGGIAIAGIAYGIYYGVS